MAPDQHLLERLHDEGVLSIPLTSGFGSGEPTPALYVATAFVFFLTWFFHAYQWFWLRGTFLLTTPDILFWSILAMLVVANTLYEARRSRKRTLGQRSMSVGDIAAQALRTAGTFTVMAVLWSLWSSDSIQDWIGLVIGGRITLESVAYCSSFSDNCADIRPDDLDWSHVGEKTEAKKATRFYRICRRNWGRILLLFFVGDPMVYANIGGQCPRIDQ